MITDIFKTSLYNVQIKKEKYVKYFLNILKKEKRTNKKGVLISNKGGYQTFNFRGMDNKEVNREVFLKPAHAFCSKLNPRENTSFKIYTHSWWINENNFGDYNELHNHYINEDHLVLTGIYYLETPKESGDLIFQNQDFNKFNVRNIIFSSTAAVYDKSRKLLKVKITNRDNSGAKKSMNRLKKAQKTCHRCAVLCRFLKKKEVR